MAYDHEYYLKNKQKFLEAQKKYIAKKRTENEKDFLEKQNQYMKEYLKSHPEQKVKKNERDKEWRKNHPDYFKNYKKKKLEESEQQ